MFELALMLKKEQYTTSKTDYCYMEFKNNTDF